MDFTRAIINKLYECPLLKYSGTAIEFAGADAKSRSMSILNTKGESVIEKYCDGGCEMRYPFKLIYRSPEIDTQGKLAAQELFDDVAEWLTKAENLPETEDARVQKIERDNTCALTSDDGNTVTFQADFSLEYFLDA